MKTAAVGLALAAWAGKAQAQIPFPYGSTVTFTWLTTGTAQPGTPVWADEYALGGYAFSAPGSSLIHIEDCCLYGDAFDVWINHAFAFSSPSVPQDGSAGYSMADWVVGPGSYLVDIWIRDNPYGYGAGFLSIGATSLPISGVPEPGSIVLVASGLLVLAGAGKMRRIMG